METHEQFMTRIEREQEAERKQLKENPLFSMVNMRIKKENQLYWLYRFKWFAEAVQSMTDKKIKVMFGKQDIRGTESITILDRNKGIVCEQIHFKNKSEMLGFVRGFLSGIDSEKNRIKKFNSLL